MAKTSQTFKKRQRENKLREKAQMKRERRQQRAMERKLPQETDEAGDAVPVSPETEQDESGDPEGSSNM